ncbi:MAG: hypothetical protein GWO24_33880, partial [Akkermansiaceae bacterium]|nr:hypothetical protein [Akkermansiaceae bacterium]
MSSGGTFHPQKKRDARRDSWQGLRIAFFRSIIERGWWLILIALLGGTAFLATGIPRLQINASTDAFLEEEDPGITVYYETREEWGTDEFAIVCITADDWFTPEGMKRLKAVEADVKAVPFVASTMSILDVPLLRQEPDRKASLFQISRSMVDMRSEGIDLAAARTEITSHELARGNLISADGRNLNLLAYLDWSKVDGKVIPSIDVRREKLVDGVREVAARWSERLPEPVRLSGIPLIQRALFENISHDLVIFGVAALVLFSLALLVVYRRPRFV